MKHVLYGLSTVILVLLFIPGCAKDNAPYMPYTPTAADTTATASLKDLQQGRTLYINSCGACHGLPARDSYSVQDWNAILHNMVARTRLSASEAELVAKYVSRGKL